MATPLAWPDRHEPVTNAIKYSPPGGTVELDVRQDPARRTATLVRQRQRSGHSRGRPRPHVFERFYRGDSTRPVAAAASGLAVVAQLVKAHGGSVRARRHARRHEDRSRLSDCVRHGRAPPSPEERTLPAVISSSSQIKLDVAGSFVGEGGHVEVVAPERDSCRRRRPRTHRQRELHPRVPIRNRRSLVHHEVTGATAGERPTPLRPCR